MNKFIKYFSVLTCTISLALSIYLNYYLLEIFELIQLLHEEVKEINSNLPNKNDCSNAESNSLFNTKNKFYLSLGCVGIGIIVLSIGVYYYLSFNDVTPINDVTSINNFTSIAIKTEPDITNDRSKGLIEFLKKISIELKNNLEESNNLHDDLIEDIYNIINLD